MIIHLHNTYVYIHIISEQLYSAFAEPSVQINSCSYYLSNPSKWWIDSTTHCISAIHYVSWINTNWITRSIFRFIAICILRVQIHVYAEDSFAREGGRVLVGVYCRRRQKPGLTTLSIIKQTNRISNAFTDNGLSLTSLPSCHGRRIHVEAL